VKQMNFATVADTIYIISCVYWSSYNMLCMQVTALYLHLNFY